MHFHICFKSLRKLILFISHLYSSFDEQDIINLEWCRVDEPIFEITHAFLTGIKRILLQTGELRWYTEPLRAEIAFELLDLRKQYPIHLLTVVYRVYNTKSLTTTAGITISKIPSYLLKYTYQIVTSISDYKSIPGLRLIIPEYFCCSLSCLEALISNITRVIWIEYRMVTITAPNVLPVLWCRPSKWVHVIAIEVMTASRISMSTMFQRFSQNLWVSVKNFIDLGINLRLQVD